MNIQIIIIYSIKRSPNPGQKTKPYNNQQKKKEFAKLSPLLSRRTTK